jgi:hypothetical protein
MVATNSVREGVSLEVEGRKQKVKFDRQLQKWHLNQMRQVTMQEQVADYMNNRYSKSKLRAQM